MKSLQIIPNVHFSWNLSWGSIFLNQKVLKTACQIPQDFGMGFSETSRQCQWSWECSPSHSPVIHHPKQRNCSSWTSCRCVHLKIYKISFVTVQVPLCGAGRGSLRTSELKHGQWTEQLMKQVKTTRWRRHNYGVERLSSGTFQEWGVASAITQWKELGSEEDLQWWMFLLTLWSWQEQAFS